MYVVDQKHFYSHSIEAITITYLYHILFYRIRVHREYTALVEFAHYWFVSSLLISQTNNVRTQATKGVQHLTLLKMFKTVKNCNNSFIMKPSYVTSQDSIPIWSTFYRQTPALQFAQERSLMLQRDLPIFSQETGNQGQRKYLVVDSYAIFWQRYRRMKRTERCYYELIQEAKPCKLYLDLEYMTALNPEHDGEQMLRTLKAQLILFIEKELNLTITEKDILDLVSSTPTKFSHHLIVLFKGNVIFKDYLSVGEFVRRFCCDIRRTIVKSTDNNLQQLSVSVSDKATVARQLFIDESVYSRNRCFRLVFSSKLKNIEKNENAFLRFTPDQPRYVCVNGRFKQQTYKDKFFIFTDTLVTAVIVDDATRVIDFPSISRRSLSNTQHARLNQTTTFEADAAQTTVDKWVCDVLSRWSRETAPWVKGMSKFPRDSVKDPVLFNAKPKSAKVVRTRVYSNSDGTPETKLYFVEGNKFCMNISRQHRSNSIYFILNYKNSYVYVCIFCL